jgi:hypothetical protein
MDNKLNTLKHYLASWNEPDKNTIQKELAKWVTADIRYCDPFTNTLQGIEELADVMLRLNKSFPGMRHEVVGVPGLHHIFGSYNWIARLSNGKKIPGVDYVEFSDDSRIAQIVTFTNMSDWN